MNKIFISVFLLVACLQSFGQDSGSVHILKPDSIKMQKRDSVFRDSLTEKYAEKPIHFSKTDTSFLSKYNDSAYSKTQAKDSLADTSLLKIQVQTALKDSVKLIDSSTKKKTVAVYGVAGLARNIPDRDLVFYILIFLLFLLGLIRVSFPKYFSSVFSLSFQATFRQSQTQEQMSQNFFPAFMLNILFILCGGLFVTLFAELNRWTTLPFWETFIYSTVILLAVYLIKYLVIRFTGWVFNAKEAAVEYSFAVFLINKLLGIAFLPLLFLIAYANDEVKSICATIAVCIAVLSLVVRYLVSLARIRKNLSVTAFHFFIYLCAVEIMPLLIIYKLLFSQAGNR